MLFTSVQRILAHGHDNRETDEQTVDRRGLGRNARFCEAGRDVAFSSGTVVSGFAWRGVAAFAAGLDAPDGAYEGDKRHVSASTPVSAGDGRGYPDGDAGRARALSPCFSSLYQRRSGAPACISALARAARIGAVSGGVLYCISICALAHLR